MVGGFGFNPLLVTRGREVLAGILRPGNGEAHAYADADVCSRVADHNFDGEERRGHAQATIRSKGESRIRC